MELWKTPAKVDGLDTGKPLEITFALSCYKEKKVTVTPKDGETVKADLEAYPRVLKVTSEPSGASVFVDGKPAGRTPTDVKVAGKLDPGKPHTVTVKKGGFTDAEMIAAPEAACAAEGNVEIALTLEAKAAPVATNIDRPKTDRPKSDRPKTDTPKTDTPKTDTPKTDTPKTDTPKTDTPATDTPKTDTPKTDTPKTDTPKTDTPKTDTPKTDTPKTDTPKTDKPSDCDPSPDAPDWARCK
jgi:hypothetical protein